MSNLGMLGLLDGLGQGVASFGTDIKNNALAKAEERRRMNLLQVQRQWNQEDAATERGWRQEDMSTERDWRQEDMNTERTWRKEDTADDRDWQLKQDEQNFRQQQEAQDKQNRWTLAHREPSEGDKLLDRAQQALQAGKISEQQYNQISLGLKSEGALDAKERADLKAKAYNQAREEVAGKDSIEGASPEQLKAIDDRANKLYDNWTGTSAPQSGGDTGGDTGGLKPGQIVEQNGKRYRIGSDGKSAIPLDGGGPPDGQKGDTAATEEKPDERPDPKPKYNPETKRTEPTNPAYIKWRAQRGLLEQQEEEANQQKWDARSKEALNNPLWSSGSSILRK